MRRARATGNIAPRPIARQVEQCKVRACRQLAPHGGTGIGRIEQGDGALRPPRGGFDIMGRKMVRGFGYIGEVAADCLMGGVKRARRAAQPEPDLLSWRWRAGARLFAR